MNRNKINLLFLLLLILVAPVIVQAQKTFSSTDSPRYSSDGKRFVFSSAVIQGSAQSGGSAQKVSSRIAVMNADGSNFRFLTPETKGVADTEPSFSPDGKKIVFRRANATANTAEPGDIYLINADGTGLKQLSADKNNELRPEFTPDGSGVIFVRKHPSGLDKPKNQAELVLVNLADGKERILIAKEFRVVQALPLTVGKGGFMVACAEIDNDGKPLPEGGMIAVASPAGELSPRAKWTLPALKYGKWEIDRFVVSLKPELTIYVTGKAGSGWAAEKSDFKITQKEVKSLKDISLFKEVNLSPDGKYGVFAYTDIRDTDAGHKVVVREIIGEDFGKEIVVGAKK